MRVFAHECGPSQIDVKVGQSYLWRIIADQTESVSIYQPLLGGAGGVAEVFPRKPFQSHHGDFLITGLKPGTNQLIVSWSYPPNSASGVCVVQITVRPDDGKSGFQTPGKPGTLGVSAGDDILDVQVHSLLTNSIPGESLKLLVFNQCFGGNLALSPLFKNLPNTAISSATSPGQLAISGGFHDDAARGLKSSPGRTALDMHEDGSTGKSTGQIGEYGVAKTQEAMYGYSEWPRTSGGLPLAKFALDPVSPNGSVHSRHIVIYAGRPIKVFSYAITVGTFTIPDEKGDKTVVSDVQDRDQIRANFQGEPNTTITTAGGDGTDGWDYPGSLEGLKRAIGAASQSIRNSADPAKEQFILVVTDHGALGMATSSQAKEVPPNSRSAIGSSIPTSAPTDPAVPAMKRQPDNQPELRVQVKPGSGQPPNRGQRRSDVPALLTAGQVELELVPDGGTSLKLRQPRITLVDLDSDGNIGSLPGEGIWLHFAIDEEQLFTNVFGRNLTVFAANFTDHTLEFSNLTITTGAIAGDNSDPAPYVKRVRRVDDGNLELTVGGIKGRRYLFEKSENLTTWKVFADRPLADFTDQQGVPIQPDVKSIFLRVSKP